MSDETRHDPDGGALDDALDARFRALPLPEPPPALYARTLAAVEAARLAELRPPTARPASFPPPTASRRPRWPVYALASSVALAAGLVLTLPSGPPVADPTELVPRGVGEAPVSLDLRVAVRHPDGTTARFATGTRYAAGDTLLFRVSASEPMIVRLEREGVTIWSGRLAAGEQDLPVGYTIEPGERGATFRVVADGVASDPLVVEVGP